MRLRATIALLLLLAAGLPAQNITRPYGTVASVNRGGSEAVWGLSDSTCSSAKQAELDASATERLVLSNFSLGIPETATVDSLAVSLSGTDYGGDNPPTYGALNLMDGTSAVGSTKNAGADFQDDTYRGDSVFWGTSIGPAVLNASTFGFGFWLNHDVGNNVTLQCASVTVWFTDHPDVPTRGGVSTATNSFKARKKFRAAIVKP